MTEELDIIDVKKCFASLGYQVITEPCDANLDNQLYSVIDAETKINIQTDLLFYKQQTSCIINWTIDKLRYSLKNADKFWILESTNANKSWMLESGEEQQCYSGTSSISYRTISRKIEKHNPFKDKSPYEMLVIADMIVDPYIGWNPLSE